MAVKISEFIIGLVVVSLIAGIFGIFMAHLNTEYPVTYDNDSIDNYNRLNEIALQSEEIKNASNIEEKQDVLDVIGSYFSDAYRALVVTKKSYETFEGMSQQAMSDLNLGSAGKLIRIALSSIVLILIFLAVIISAVLKRDL